MSFVSGNIADDGQSFRQPEWAKDVGRKHLHEIFTFSIGKEASGAGESAVGRRLHGGDQTRRRGTSRKKAQKAHKKSFSPL